MGNKSNREPQLNREACSGPIASGFVADGYTRLVCGIEAEVRSEVESQYADAWNSSRWLDRWRLKKQIDAEVAELTARRLADVSDKSLF